MRLRDYLSIATRALRANPVRTSLTILCIVIAVGAMVSISAIGAGARAQVQRQIQSFGANVIMVSATARNRQGGRTTSNANQPLTTEDAHAVAQLSSVGAAAPSVAGPLRVVHGNLNWQTTVNGTTPERFRIRGWRLAGGRLFSPDEERDGAKVVILGAEVAKRLFPEGNAEGEIVRIANAPFAVIGVLAPKGTSGDGQTQDDVVFVPLTTAIVRLVGTANAVNREAVAYILASARSDADVAAATGDIRRLIDQRHRIAAGEESGYTVTTAASILAAQEASTRAMAMLLASVAAVSLVVCGISIMNIMLVAVRERTREIGLRLAIGASQRDVRKQFLLEAVVLCTVGGVCGVAVGSLAALAIGAFAGWSILLEPRTALAAIFFAGLIGVFFGYYPARQASLLQPVAALRSD
ncbi:MAG: ABC transporter permease [Rhizobiales bacterium]|nr:ABC transporter permease [Hyphomicrobiales bacterium]